MLGKDDFVEREKGAESGIGDPSPQVSPPPRPDQKVKIMEGERELTTGLLSKETSFRLIVSGSIGVKEIDRLIRKLELDKEILAEPEPGEGEHRQ